jgi:spermidine/putrescine transport system substrate-binding protein
VSSQQAIDNAKDLAFVYPAEGFPISCDVAAILRESKRTELAHQFLNYLLRPKVAAAVVVAARTACANETARTLLPAEIRENDTLFPSVEILERGEWIAASTPEVQRLRDRLWTEVKSA